MLLFSRAATTSLKPISPPRRFGTVVASSHSSSSSSFVGARSSLARVYQQQQQRRKKKRCCSCCCSGRRCRSFVVASGNRDDDDNDERKQSFAENEDSGKIGTKRRARTGILNRVPNVAQSKDILLSGLKRSQRITHTSGLRVPLLKERNKSAKQLDGLTTALCKPLGVRESFVRVNGGSGGVRENNSGG